MEKVNILLPTYNGEKYLRDQLNSLINQTYKNLDVYIRDDGSTDKTEEIIDEYCNKNVEGIHFIKVDDGKRLGYPDCYWELIQVAKEAPYYAFCDQDDMWYPEKIESAISELSKLDEDKPNLCFCEFNYCDGNMKYLRKGDFYNDDVNLSFEKGMYYTYAPGFTQVMNKKLIQMINTEKLMGQGMFHDIYCQWIASSLGNIVKNNVVLAHDMAVTSANKGKISSIKYWWNQEIKGEKMIHWKKSLFFFKEQFYSDCDASNKLLLDKFIEEQNSLIRKFAKIFYNKRLRPTLGGEIALRIIFLLGVC